VEKAQEAIKEEDATAMMKKMLSAKFDFSDFLKQYQTVNRMGNVSSVMKMMPGMTGIDDKQLQEVEKKYAVFESIIQVRLLQATIASLWDHDH
jgi:signal recognition particle subunit SRP54